MSYAVERHDDGDKLVDNNDNVVYEWDGGYNWPDDDAVSAMIDDARIGEPQKSFFETVFLGPEIDDSNLTVHTSDDTS